MTMRISEKELAVQKQFRAAYREHQRKNPLNARVNERDRFAARVLGTKMGQRQSSAFSASDVAKSELREAERKILKLLSPLKLGPW